MAGRAGEVWRIDTRTKEKHLVGKIETDVAGDRGLHGIAFHPDFPRVPQLFLFHHDPDHDDAKVDSMQEWARELAAIHGSSLEVEAAREGVEVILGAAK